MLTVVEVNHDTYGSYIATRYAALFWTAFALYLPAIYLGKVWMRHRRPYTLKWPTFIWNLSLSLLSGLASAVYIVRDPGCILKMHIPHKELDPSVSVVINLFLLTKSVEFGDTLFLVLKKKPLVFLHVYHHLTVAMYSWHAQSVNVTFAHSLCFVNLTVHWIMYGYYAWSTLTPKFWLLRGCRRYITGIQTIQMFVGIWFALRTLARFQNAGPLYHNAIAGLLMYVSYAYLFVHFYLQNYMSEVKSTMAMGILTVYCCAFVGAWKLWQHPSFWTLIMEVGVGFAYTAAIFRLFCIPPQGGPTSPKQTKLHSSSTQDSPFSTLTPKPTATAGPVGKEADKSVARCPDSSVSSDQQSAASKPHRIDAGSAMASAQINPQLEQQNGWARTLLVVQNPWITWASEIVLAKKQLMAYVDSDTPSTPISLVEELLIEADPVTKLSEDLPRYKQSDYLYAMLSVITTAYTGYLLHADWMLGVLVHGCLRWVVELHTTNRVLTKYSLSKLFNRDVLAMLGGLC